MQASTEKSSVILRSLAFATPGPVQATPTYHRGWWEWAPQLVDAQSLRQAIQGLLFPMLWLFIGTVSAYDTYLTIKYQDSIVQMETNPIGSYLLAADNGHTSAFIGLKFMGTIMVLGFLGALRRFFPDVAQWTTGAVACFQLGLLGYLILV